MCSAAAITTSLMPCCVSAWAMRVEVHEALCWRPRGVKLRGASQIVKNGSTATRCQCSRQVIHTLLQPASAPRRSEAGAEPTTRPSTPCTIARAWSGVRVRAHPNLNPNPNPSPSLSPSPSPNPHPHPHPRVRARVRVRVRVRLTLTLAIARTAPPKRRISPERRSSRSSGSAFLGLGVGLGFSI